jgi:hypothetical protein
MHHDGLSALLMASALTGERIGEVVLGNISNWCMLFSSVLMQAVSVMLHLLSAPRAVDFWCAQAKSDFDCNRVLCLLQNDPHDSCTDPHDRCDS